MGFGYVIHFLTCIFNLVKIFRYHFFSHHGQVTTVATRGFDGLDSQGSRVHQKMDTMIANGHVSFEEYNRITDMKIVECLDFISKVAPSVGDIFGLCLQPHEKNLRLYYENDSQIQYFYIDDDDDNNDAFFYGRDELLSNFQILEQYMEKHLYQHISCDMYKRKELSDIERILWAHLCDNHGFCINSSPDIGDRTSCECDTFQEHVHLIFYFKELFDFKFDYISPAQIEEEIARYVKACSSIRFEIKQLKIPDINDDDESEQQRHVRIIELEKKLETLVQEKSKLFESRDKILKKNQLLDDRAMLIDKLTPIFDKIKQLQEDTEIEFAKIELAALTYINQQNTHLSKLRSELKKQYLELE